MLDDYDLLIEEQRYPSLLVGPTLREARLRAGKKQGDVARYLNLDSSVPPRWEGHIGSTRYKPLPGKYILPLAQFFGCSVYDIAPQLHDLAPIQIAAHHDYSATLERGSMLTYCSTTTSAGRKVYSTYEPSFVPPPVPGVPPMSLREQGAWRRVCRHCHHEYIETQTSRAPMDCVNCGAALRARPLIAPG